MEALAARARKRWQLIKDRHHSRSAPDNLFTDSESSPWQLLISQFEELMKLSGASDEWQLSADADSPMQALLSGHHPLGVLHANVLEVSTHSRLAQCRPSSHHHPIPAAVIERRARAAAAAARARARASRSRSDSPRC